MIGFAGRVWRIVPQGAPPLLPAHAPEGRFHHSGQWAIYTSLSAEGTVVAIQRYIAPDDPPRRIMALQADAARVADFRGDSRASVIWQGIRATGLPSPTWQLSDTARAEGAQALLYSSRSRPDLTHLVVFDPNVLAQGPAELTRAWP